MDMTERAMLCVAAAAMLMTGGRAQERAPEPKAGSVCVAAVKDVGDDRGYVSDKFAVRIDDGGWIAVPAGQPTRIPDLTLEGKHLVRIRDGGKQIQSFRFEFSGFKSRELCLWYKHWYETWSLWDAADGGQKCRCPAAGSSDR